MKSLRGRKFGKWQSGNYWKDFDADQFREAVEKASVGVRKPTALEQKGDRWRVYHKPMTPGENWD